MKKEVRELHYETLFRIVVQRYDGVTPISIKQYLLDESDFKFKTDAKDKAVILEKKTAYIHKEVNEALKKLSYKPVTEEDDPEGFPPEDDTNEQEVEDYESYPHTLVIGIPEVLKDGRNGKKNASYRLNTNVKFSIDDEYDLLLATRHLYNLYTAENGHDVNAPMVRFLTQRRDTIDDFEFKDFSLLIDTFVQMNTHEVYYPNEYSLELLLALISLKADLNITIQNSKSTFTMSKVSINELVFNTDGFSLVCDGMSVVIKDMNEIKLIESSCETSFKENSISVRKTLEHYPAFVQEYFEKKIDHLEGLILYFNLDL